MQPTRLVSSLPTPTTAEADSLLRLVQTSSRQSVRSRSVSYLSFVYVLRCALTCSAVPHTGVAVVPDANNNGAERPAQATAAGSPTCVTIANNDYWETFAGDAMCEEPQPKKARTLPPQPDRTQTPTLMDRLTPATAAAAPVNALTLTRNCASDEDDEEFWGRSFNLDLSKEPRPVRLGPSAKLSELGTFTRHPELTLRIGWFGKESNDWSTFQTAKTLYYRSPDSLVYRSLIDCRRAHYHNEASTQAGMHELKLNFDSEEDGDDDDIFAEVAAIMRD